MKTDNTRLYPGIFYFLTRRRNALREASNNNNFFFLNSKYCGILTKKNEMYIIT